MKELFTVMLVWEDERLGDVVNRVEAERLRLVLVRNSEPVALLIPFADHDALEVGLWEKGAKEHLAKIFGDDVVGAPAGFNTSELPPPPGDAPSAENFDLVETNVLMQYEACKTCGAWVPKADVERHECGR